MERVVEAAGSVLQSNIKTEPVDIIDTETNSPGAGESGTTDECYFRQHFVVILDRAAPLFLHSWYASTIVLPHKLIQAKIRRTYVNISTRVIRLLLGWMHNGND